jgi:hypothetical protein
MVALLAVLAAAKPKPSSVCLYSACAGFLVLIFIAAGGGLTAGGIALKMRGNPVSDFLATCEENMNSMGVSYCERKKLCTMMREARDRVFAFALGTGVPLFVAGDGCRVPSDSPVSPTPLAGSQRQAHTYPRRGKA